VTLDVKQKEFMKCYPSWAGDPPRFIENKLVGLRGMFSIAELKKIIEIAEKDYKDMV